MITFYRCTGARTIQALAPGCCSYMISLLVGFVERKDPLKYIVVGGAMVRKYWLWTCGFHFHQPHTSCLYHHVRSVLCSSVCKLREIAGGLLFMVLINAWTREHTTGFPVLYLDAMLLDSNNNDEFDTSTKPAHCCAQDSGLAVETKWKSHYRRDVK